MTIGVYHKHWLLFETDNETKAWEMAQQYSKWFSRIEVRKVEQEYSARK